MGPVVSRRRAMEDPDVGLGRGVQKQERMVQRQDLPRKPFLWRRQCLGRGRMGLGPRFPQVPMPEAKAGH